MDVSGLDPSFPIVGRSTVAQTFTTAVLTNIFGLTVSIPTGTFKVEAIIWYKASEAGNLKLQWTLPNVAAFAGSWCVNGLSLSITTQTEAAIRRAAVGWLTPDNVGGAGVGVQLFANPIGILNNPTTAGNLTLQACQLVDDGTTLEISARSALIVTPI
jgi:hypothetical protein